MTEQRAQPAGSNLATTARSVVQKVVAPESSTWSSVLAVVIAFFTALVISAVFIVFSDPNVIQAPGFTTALSTAWADISGAYGSLLSGALGDPSTLFAKLGSGDEKTIARVRNGVTPGGRV